MSNRVARREASLVRMARVVRLPPRGREERQGAYYRRCAARWLQLGAPLDPEHRAEVLALCATNAPRGARPEACSA